VAAPDPVEASCLDRAKITAETRSDGKYLLSTSDPDLSAEDVALGYKNLLEAERWFRDLKSTIESRCSTASSPASALRRCSAGSCCY
jgi:hypothetical protein